MVSLVSQHISGRQKLGFADPVEPVDRAGVDRVGGWFAHPSVRTLDSGWPITLVPPSFSLRWKACPPQGIGPPAVPMCREGLT